MGEREECRELLEQLSAWLDGDLDEGSCASLEEHLRRCSRCRTCREILSASLSLCGRRSELSDDARSRILGKVRRELGGD